MFSPEHDRTPLARAAERAWQLILVTGAVLLAGYLAKMLSAVLIPLAIGLLMAALVRPAVTFLEDHRWPRMLAVLLPMTILSAVLAGGITAVVFSVQNQADVLEKSARTVGDMVTSMMSFMEAHLGEGTLESAKQSLRSNLDRIPRMIASAGLQLVQGVLFFLLAIAFCFFFLIDRKAIARGARNRLSAKTYARLEDITSRSSTGLEQYLRGISLTALANALMFGLAMLLIGVPLVIPIMVVTFMGSFLPYVGPITATLLASMLALGQGGWLDALLVVVAGAITQAVEGNLLHPFLVGRSVHISPFLTILAVTTFGTIGGIIGALIAIPLVLIILLIDDVLRGEPKPS